MTSSTGLRERLDLAGGWQLAFDPDGQGARAGWPPGRWPEARAERVQVPAIWNVTHPDADGIGYYRRTFAVPVGWAGRVVRLNVGGASYRLEAWVNGRFVGSHEGSYTPCRFEVTGAIRPGEENELVLRVTSLSRTRAVDGMVLREMPAAKQSWYYAYGGLWGEVALEAVSPLRCESIAVEPDLRLETAHVEVAVANAGAESRVVDLALTVVGPGGDIAAEVTQSVAVPPGMPRYFFSLPIPRPAPWSCAQPNLYRVRAALVEGGSAIDELTATFGMRDFTVNGGRFLLNGEQVFLRGALLQPNYPVGLVAPLDPTLIEREVLLAKEAGFNLIRVHLRPAAPGLLDLTDRLGMLVYAETSLAWLQDTPRLLDHGRREVTALIERDRNHPSVVFWGIFNEHRAPAARYADALVRTARALDPTRVVLDDSGGTLAMDQDYGWANRATVVPNRSTTRVPVHDLHVYIGAPVTPAACEWLRTLGTPRPTVDVAALGFGSPAIFEELYRQLRTDPSQVFVSELGCGGMADLDEVVAGFGDRLDLLDAREFVAFRDSLHEGFSERGLDRVFGSVGELYRAAQRQQATGNRRQIEALLTNPRISGYILTQLQDVCCEFHAGIIDLWRRPKTAFGELKRLNHDRCLVLRSERPVMVTGDRVDVALTLVDRVPVPAGGRVRLAVVDPAGAVIAGEDREVPPGQGIKELGKVAVQTGSLAGEYRVEARLIGDGEADVVTIESVLALPPVDRGASPEGVAWLGAVPGAGRGEPAVVAPGDRPRAIVAGEPGSLTPSDWETLLAAVEAGATGLVGPLRPGDETAIRALATRGLDVKLHFGIGNWLGCYHWQPASALFAGLPAGGLAEEVYADVLPRYVLSELGGEVLAGSLSNTQTRQDVAKMLWYSDVETVALGEGRLLYCQYRIFDQASEDPLAGRMLINLLGIAMGEASGTW
jgi:hypothetical protein